MKNSVLLLVLSFLLSNIVFAQFGKISKVFNIDDEFNHNEMLLPLTENGRLDKELLDYWRLDSTIVYDINSEIDSTDIIKNTVFYDYINNTIDYAYSLKLPPETEWQNQSRSLVTLNDENEQIQTLFYQGDGQDWILRDKTVFIDTDTLKISLRYHWDLNTEVWVNGHKYEFYYNSLGKNYLTLEYFNDNQTNNWRRQWKTEYLYNGLGERELKIQYIWSVESDIWVNYKKTTYTFDDNIESSVFYIWDEYEWLPFSKSVGTRVDPFTERFDGYLYNEELDWIHDYIIENGYDEIGNVIFQRRFSYSESDSTWMGDKFENLYNETGQLINKLYFKLNLESEEWYWTIKEQYNYNNLGLHDYWSYFVWSNSDNSWVKDKSMFSFYSNPSSITEYDANYFTIQINPNPSTTQISFNCENPNNIKVLYAIYTISGSIVKEGVIQSSNTIGVDELNNGYYFIKIEVGNKQYSGKFLKL